MDWWQSVQDWGKQSIILGKCNIITWLTAEGGLEELRLSWVSAQLVT